MLHDIQVTAEQLKTAARWAQDGDMAPVLLECRPGGQLYAGQGDERALIGTRGDLLEGEAPATPLHVTPLQINNAGQDALIELADAVLAEIAGRVEDADEDADLFHEAMDHYDGWREAAKAMAERRNEPEPFEGGAGDEPGPAGGEEATWDDVDGSICQHCDGRIPPEREHCPDCGARSALVGEEARAAAQDEDTLPWWTGEGMPAMLRDSDGVPIFSHETRRAAAHVKVAHGRCPVCGHYGEDCTGDHWHPAPVCTCGIGNAGWMNHARGCPVRIDAETRSLEERARDSLARAAAQDDPRGERDR